MNAPAIIPLRSAERAARVSRRGIGPADPSGTDAAPECPVTPLGHRNGMFYFFDNRGQLRELAAQHLGQGPQLVALFGKPDWLIARAPAFDKDGNPVDWFNVRKVNALLVGMCQAAGLFDPSQPKRGHGVWRSDGRVALHLGDSVLFPDSGERRPAGFRSAGALWPALPSIPAPAAPAPVADACRVETMFGAWNWERGDAGARVFTGIWAAGLLGAAIGWRAHAIVVGPPGSGKSSLFDLLAALSPMAEALNDYTEPGIRQAVTGRAAPLLLDEADEDPESMGRLQRVIGMLRRASGGAGAVVLKGGSNGVGQRFEVMSPALLGAVLPPPLLPQDETRFTRLDIAAMPLDGAARPLPGAAGIEWSRAHAAGLWGRALAGLARFDANLAAIRADLLGLGCTPRLADQLGTILAARAMMLRDAPLTDTEAAEEVDAVRWLACTAEAQAQNAGPALCLQRLLSSASDMTIAGEHPSLGALIAQAAAHSPDTSHARRQLTQHGLAIRPFPFSGGGPVMLHVANAHPRLTKVYDGTAWASGRWREDLRRLRGAVEPANPVKFGEGSNLKPRCIVLPLDVLPDERADD